MRLVRPIAEIDSSYSESAWWGLMICIIFTVFFLGGFGTWTTSIVVSGDKDKAVAGYRHDEHLAVLAACANEVDENTVDCVHELDDYMGVTDTEEPAG